MPPQQGNDEFAQYVRKPAAAPADEFAQFARSSPSPEAQALATPPKAPMPTITPKFTYPIPGQEQLVGGIKKVGEVAEKGMDVMGGKALGRFEQRHPQFGPSMGMASGIELGSQPVASITEEVMSGLKQLPREVQRETERLAGVPKAIKEEKAAAKVTQEGNIAKYRESEQATKQAQEAARARNISTYREAEQHLAEKQAEVAAANKADREAYQAAKKSAVEEQGKQDVIAARKANLAKTTEQIKPALQKNLHDVQDAVFNDLDQRWDKVRTAVGTTVKANPQSIATAMNTSMKSVTTVNQDLFTKVVENAFGGASPAKLSWPEAQAAYTNLGSRLAQGGLPGDVWRSLKSFQDALGTEMESMANAAGVKNDFVAVKKDWSQAMGDLKDTSKAIAKGGSPIAHALAKADPSGAAKVFEGPLTGPANRALKILGRYKNYGADVSYPLRYRNMLDEAETLPKPKSVRMPTEPAPRATPEMTSASYKPGPPDVNVADYKTHPVDREAIRKGQMSKFKKKAAVGIGSGAGLTVGMYELYQKLFGSGGASTPQP